jgi:hypothetical protein
LEGEEDVLVEDVLYSSFSPFPSPLLLSDQVKGRGEVADWDDKEEGEDGVQQQWEDDWDDDDVTDDFSVQLRKELESAGES